MIPSLEWEMKCSRNVCALQPPHSEDLSLEGGIGLAGISLFSIVIYSYSFIDGKSKRNTIYHSQSLPVARALARQRQEKTYLKGRRAGILIPHSIEEIKALQQNRPYPPWKQAKYNWGHWKPGQATENKSSLCKGKHKPDQENAVKKLIEKNASNIKQVHRANNGKSPNTAKEGGSLSHTTITRGSSASH